MRLTPTFIRRLQSHRQQSARAFLGQLGGRPNLGHTSAAQSQLHPQLDVGHGVTGFHLSNMLIHLANAYLAYLLAKAFVRQQWQAIR